MKVLYACFFPILIEWSWRFNACPVLFFLSRFARVYYFASPQEKFQTPRGFQIAAMSNFSEQHLFRCNKVYLGKDVFECSAQRPGGNWSRVDQTALKQVCLVFIPHLSLFLPQSLQRVREKVKRSYSLTSEYSVTSEYSLSSGYSGPSLSARTISDFKFPAARQDRPLVPLNNLDGVHVSFSPTVKPPF